MPVVLVFVGGGLGAVARYLTAVAYGRAFGPRLAFVSTGLVNVLGGLLMGLLIGVLALRGGAGQERWRLLLGVGVLGGFTTFSSFSLETVLLLQRHAYLTAGAYAVGSVGLSLVALAAGLHLARLAGL